MTSEGDITNLTCPQLKTLICCLTNSSNSCAGMRKKELRDYCYGLLQERKAGIRYKTFTELRSVPAFAYSAYCEDNSKNDRQGEPPYWRKQLIEKGWCTVPIMTDEVVGIFASKFWDFLENTCPEFNRNDMSTWLQQNRLHDFFGIFTQYVCHTEWFWQIREMCYPYFKDIWLQENLLTSFDGGCFMPPSQNNINENLEEPYSINHWMHCDTPREYTNFCCVQGLVNLLDNGPMDGGLVLVEDSQNLHKEYLEKYKSHGIKRYRIDLSDPIVKNKRILKICAPKGHLVLWDSRMFHCNTEPLSNKPRMCVYVSMQPKSLASADQLEKRVKLYKEGRGTGHWVGGVWFTPRGLHPRYAGDNSNIKKLDVASGCLRQLEIAALNPLRKKLIGIYI